MNTTATPTRPFPLLVSKPSATPTVPRMRAHAITLFEDDDPTLVIPAAALASLREASDPSTGDDE